MAAMTGSGDYPHYDPMAPSYGVGQMVYVRTAFLPPAMVPWREAVELAKVEQVFTGGHMFPRYRVRLVSGGCAGVEYTVTGTAITCRRPRPDGRPTLPPVMPSATSPDGTWVRLQRVLTAPPARSHAPRVAVAVQARREEQPVARRWLKMPWWLGGESEVRRRS